MGEVSLYGILYFLIGSQIFGPVLLFGLFLFIAYKKKNKKNTSLFNGTLSAFLVMAMFTAYVIFLMLSHDAADIARKSVEIDKIIVYGVPLALSAFLIGWVITKKSVESAFSALIGIFLLLVIFFAVPIPDAIHRKLFLVAAILGLAFFVLGVVLTVLTFKKKIKGKLKWFLLMTGVSSAVVLPSVILHNLVYGLFIYLFGADFWGKGGDEPFFLILGMLVCPIVFLVGSVGSVVLLIRKRQ